MKTLSKALRKLGRTWVRILEENPDDPKAKKLVEKQAKEVYKGLKKLGQTINATKSKKTK